MKAEGSDSLHILID